MSTHELKIWPQHFAPVREGQKTAEFRRDDRNFQPGDLIRFREFQPDTGTYTGESCHAIILHVTRGEPLPDGFCLLSLAIAARRSVPERFRYMSDSTPKP